MIFFPKRRSSSSKLINPFPILEYWLLEPKFAPILPLAHRRNLGRKWMVKIPGVGKEMGFVARILTGGCYGTRGLSLSNLYQLSI